MNVPTMEYAVKYTFCISIDERGFDSIQGSPYQDAVSYHVGGQTCVSVQPLLG